MVSCHDWCNVRGLLWAPDRLMKLPSPFIHYHSGLPHFVAVSIHLFGTVAEIPRSGVLSDPRLTNNWELGMLR